MEKKKIVGINGSASENSSNLAILKFISELGKADFDLEIIDDLSVLPHFRTNLIEKDTPQSILDFRSKIENASGIIICTPEYIFSIPSGLKNAIGWCVSTTVFKDKPLGIITASASGNKGHEELKLIMQTVQTVFLEETTLHIRGIKGKISQTGLIIDEKTDNELKDFVKAYSNLLMLV